MKWTRVRRRLEGQGLVRGHEEAQVGTACEMSLSGLVRWDRRDWSGGLRVDVHTVARYQYVGGGGGGGGTIWTLKEAHKCS